MPKAMLEDFSKLRDYDKTDFLLSGLKCNVTIEWVNLYKKILIWVHELYSERKRIYVNIDA